MKKILLAALFITAFGQLHAADGSTARDKAKQLNTQGFRLYKQGRYYQALPLFHRATQADKNYVLGQYNFACTATIILEDFDCNYDNILEFTNFDTIIASLKQAVKLDPKRKSRSKTDPDLAYLRKNYRYYHEVLGYSPDNDQQLAEMLEQLEWQDTGGSYYHVGYKGEPAALTFKDGKVTVKEARPIDEKTGDQKPKNTYYSGKYDIDNGIVTLIFNRPGHGRQQITGQLIDKSEPFHGVLVFAGASQANILPADRFTFHEPHPCEAP